MQSKMRKTGMIGWTAGILLVFILFLLWLARTQQLWTHYDLESYQPNGYKAINLLLARHHYRLAGIASFDPRSQGPLVVYTPAEISFAAYKPILNWVKSGGILVELPEAGPRFGMFSGFPVKVPGARAITSGHPWFKDLPYQPASPSVYGIAHPEGGFYAIKGSAFIYQQKLGKGTVVTWCDPKGITNAKLKQTPDNGVIFGILIKHTLAAGTLSFLDLRNPTQTALNNGIDLRELLGRNSFPLLIGVVAFGLALWKLAARLGRPRPLTLIRGRSYDEFVLFLAQLFRRAKADTLVLENLWDAFKTTALSVTGLPFNAPAAVILERLQGLTGQTYQPLLEIERLLGVQPLPLSKKQFLKLAASLDAYRKELLEWKKSKHSLLH